MVRSVLEWCRMCDRSVSASSLVWLSDQTTADIYDKICLLHQRIVDSTHSLFSGEMGSGLRLDS